MKADFLAQLIGSLNSKEVRALRGSDYLSKGKWSAERTLLFNALLNNPHLTLEQQQARFCGSPYLKVFLKERHRMYPELVSFLLDLERRNPESRDPWMPLEESRLLLTKGLTEQAAHRAKEGITIAEEVHDLHAQLVLREQLRNTYKLMPRQALSTEITENDYRLEMVSRQVANLTRYTAINDRISDLQNRYHIADDISVRSAMDALMEDELMTHIKHAISLPAQIRFSSISAYHAQCTGKLEEAMDHLREAVTLWESSPARIAYLPHLYRQTLGNLIGLYILSGNLDQVPLLIKRMEQVPVQGQRAEMLAFCDTELQYQLYYMNSGQLQDVIDRESMVRAGIKKFTGLIIESKELSLLYNLGVVHLVVGNDDLALRCFNDIRNKGRLESRLDLQSTARIFRLLLLLERDDTANFDYYLRSNRRSFRKHVPSFEMMEMVYGWLDRHRADFHSLKRNQLLKELHAQLEPFENERVVGAEELRLWIKSRAEGHSIMALLKAEKR
jgi:hypothetical protein